MLKWIFGKILTTKLKNDKEFMNSVDKYHESAANLAESIKKLEKQGIEVPEDIKKLANMSD